MSKLKNIWEKYKKRETIGYGIFGNVYKGKYNDEYYAIKEIQKSKSGGTTFLREIEVMKKMECDNMVKIIESIELKNHFILYLNYVVQTLNNI